MIKLLSRDHLKDSNVSLLYDYTHKNSDTLIVSFAGLGQILEEAPRFEFSGVFRDYETKKIFARDLQNRAYHAGLLHLTNDLLSTADLLREQVEQANVNRVVMVGNCQGAYAAILFGALLGVSQVIAFSPITYLDAANRIKYDEYRWPEAFERFYKTPTATVRYFDLTNVPGTDRVPIDIYFDPDCRPDRNFVTHFAGEKSNVRLIEGQGGGHLLVQNMHRSGHLQKVLRQSVLKFDKSLS